MKEPPVVVLSSVDWDAAWQRHHAFAAQWAASGRPVYFVENTGVRNPGLGDLARLRRRLMRLFGARAGRREPPPPGLRVIAPLVLPPTWPLFRALNGAFFIPRLAAQLRAAGLGPGALAVCYLPTTTTLQLLRALAPGQVVYDCVDNFHGLSDRPSDLDETEHALLDLSSLVVTTSQTLYERKAAEHPRVLRLHHGVPDSFFIDAPQPRAFKRFCYFGTLWSALDYEAIAALAKAGFEVALIGPQKEQPPALPPGVSLRPAISHRELPDTLRGFDALLLPYADTPYNVGVIPAKTYECLATGLPVIASPLPSLLPLEKELYLAKTPADWVRAARALGETETPERRAARLELAGRHRDGAQFAALAGAIESARGAGAASTGGAATPAETFMRGIGWIAVLYGLAKLSTLFTQVVAGRLLGPLFYGRANLAIAIAAYLQIVPMLGFPLAISKFVAAEDDEPRRRELVGTALTLFVAWAALTLGALALSIGFLSQRAGISDGLLKEALALAAATAAYTVLSSPLLGLRRFDARGLTEALYGLAAPLLLAAFWLSGLRSEKALIWALCASLALACLAALGALRDWARPRWSPATAKTLFGYAAVASLHLLATACVLAPGRIVLHDRFGAREVGVFSAYFTSTTQLALAMLTMLNAVLVPVAGNAEGQAASWRGFLRGRLTLFAAGWALFFATATAGLLLFGRQYPLRWDWAALFAGAAAMMLVHGVMAAILAARDFKGLCVSVLGSLGAGLVNAALCVALIPRYGIAGAGWALVGGFAVGLACFALFGPRRR